MSESLDAPVTNRRKLAAERLAVGVERRQQELKGETYAKFCADLGHVFSGNESTVDWYRVPCARCGQKTPRQLPQ